MEGKGNAGRGSSRENDGKEFQERKAIGGREERGMEGEGKRVGRKELGKRQSMAWQYGGGCGMGMGEKV